MTTFNVSSAAELMTAAARARGGDTIALAAGRYDTVILRDIKFASEVTVTSADPKHAAELTGLKAIGVENLTFRNVIFADQNAATAYDFEIKNAAGVHFDQVVIRGQAGEAGYQSNAFMVRGSTDVSITNSEITHLRYGINMLDNVGVTVKGNYFHDMRADGFHGGGLSKVLVADNVFTDFHPADGDHPDAIQFWTANQTRSASDITITGNVIMRGDGGTIQGIFMGDETNHLPYRNVTIADNLVVGGMYNGIHVEQAEGLTLTDNIVAGYPDQASWIRVGGADVISGNVAQLYVLDGKTVPAPEGNATTPPIYDKGIGVVGDWLAANPDWLRFAHGSTLLDDVADDLVDLSLQTPPPPPTTVLTGTAAADRLSAAEFGDSVLRGGDGNDQLTGGNGQTRMEGGAGNDLYFVHSARDLVVERAGGGSDTVYASVDYRLPNDVETLRLAVSGLTGHGNALANKITGTAGRDWMYGEAGNDSLQGLDGNDVLDGGDGADTLSGGTGHDSLVGGGGNDTLIGGDGNDRIWGGAQKDSIEGGAGDDHMSGGAGADTFHFRPDVIGDHDVITDFSAAQGDKIGLSLIDAVAGTPANEAFRFIGTNAFSGQAGELRYEATAAGVTCTADINGDALADFTLSLDGVTSLTAAAFVL